MQEKNLSVRQDKTSLTNTSQQAQTWTTDSKAKLAAVMGTVCSLQRTYGKTTDELKTIVEGFAWILAPYAPEAVISAIGKFVLTSPLIPTPYEIRNILDPVKEPFKPDWAVYNRLRDLLKEGGPYALGDDEIKYMKACQDNSMSKLPD